MSLRNDKTRTIYKLFGPRVSKFVSAILTRTLSAKPTFGAASLQVQSPSCFRAKPEFERFTDHGFKVAKIRLEAGARIGDEG